MKTIKGVELWKNNKREQPTGENTDEKDNTSVTCATKHCLFAGFVAAVLKFVQTVCRRTYGA
jgi:hypothetical protein